MSDKNGTAPPDNGGMSPKQHLIMHYLASPQYLSDVLDNARVTLMQNSDQIDAAKNDTLTGVLKHQFQSPEGSTMNLELFVSIKVVEEGAPKKRILSPHTGRVN